MSKRNRQNREDKKKKTRARREMPRGERVRSNTRTASADLSPDAPDLSVTYWLVAFLDMLGYQSVLERINHAMTPPYAANADLSDAIGRAVRVRRRLLGLMEQYSPGEDILDLGAAPAHIPDERIELIRRSRRFKTLRISGPDNIILGCSLAPQADHFPMRACATLFTHTASAMLLQLWIGADNAEDALPLRGGIDVAPGFLAEPEKFLYSPALSRAYTLESKTAKYPRTIVGPSVTEMLQQAIAGATSDEEGRMTHILASMATQMLVRDDDGHTMVDFFGPEFRRTMQHNSEAPSIAAGAWQFARQAEIRHRSSPRLHEKYQWLVEYMRPRLNLWGLSS